jgi:hypothetical protein
MTWDTISHPSLVLRGDYEPFVGGLIGGSYYIGNAGIFGLDQPTDQKIHTTLKEFHGELKWQGAFVRAQYSKGLLHDSPILNEIVGTTGLNGIGKRIVGGYVEGGWNLWWRRDNGQMLMPYIRGEASKTPDSAFLMHIAKENASGGTDHPAPLFRGVRTARHTYAVAPEGRWCLYDNREDPYQTRNLIDDPGRAKLIGDLDGILAEWLRKAQDPFAKPPYGRGRDLPA